MEDQRRAARVIFVLVRTFAAITGYVYPLPADLLVHTRNSTHGTAARISFPYLPLSLSLSLHPHHR